MFPCFRVIKCSDVMIFAFTFPRSSEVLCRKNVSVHEYTHYAFSTCLKKLLGGGACYITATIQVYTPRPFGIGAGPVLGAQKFPRSPVTPLSNQSPSTPQHRSTSMVTTEGAGPARRTESRVPLLEGPFEQEKPKVTRYQRSDETGRNSRTPPGCSRIALRQFWFCRG